MRKYFHKPLQQKRVFVYSNKWYSFFCRIVGFKSKGNETSIGSFDLGPGRLVGNGC